MQVAVIGTGKTGGAVVELLAKEHLHSTYDSQSPPTPETLRGADVAIVFTPGEAVAAVSEVLMEAKLPAVWGSTGFEWPEDIDSRLRQAKLPWVHSSNYSLGIVVMRQVLGQVGKMLKILQDPKCHLIDVHHVHKRDQPSGTALSLKESLDYPLTMESIREGDVVGTHRLEIETATEVLLFEHEAKSRKIFAEGAIYAAKRILSSPPGLHSFQEMMQ